jgi:hypothetical protein
MGATTAIFLAIGLGGIALWAASLWPNGALARAIRLAPPSWVRTWLVAYPVLSALITTMGAMFVVFPQASPTTRQLMATAFLALAVLTAAAFVWALVPVLPIPKFLLRVQIADELGETAGRSVATDAAGTVTVTGRRPLTALVLSLAFLILGILLGLWDTRPLGIAIGVAAAVLGGVGVLALAVPTVRGISVVLSAEGITDRTTVVTRRLNWQQVGDVTATSRGVVVTATVDFGHTPPQTGTRLNSRTAGFVIQTLMLSITTAELAALISDLKTKSDSGPAT